MTRVCRGCRAVRLPPIEGPCPHCRGYYRTVVPRGRAEDDGAPDEGPESAAALLARHGDDASLSLRPTGLSGLDHVFGGGLPEAGVILLSAKEGTGKTSLLWELFLSLALQRIRSQYLSLEQGKKQLVQQFSRFGAERIERAGRHLIIDAQKSLADVLDSVDRCRPEVAAIDSVHWVQGVLDDHGEPMKSGSAGAVERVAREVKALADDLGVLVFLVGHMNNDGSMAGGHALRHAVDATLGLHRKTDNPRDPRRVLRFETKTRYGEMGREALFRMSDDGFRDCGPIVHPVPGDDEDDDEDDDAPPRPVKPARPAVPRQPRQPGQVIPFPKSPPPVTDDPDGPPGPPTAA